MNQDNDEDLQLAQRIIELTKVVEENKEGIEKLTIELREGSSTIEKCEKQLQDWNVKLGTDFEEVNNQITALEEKDKQQAQNLDQKLGEVSETISNLKDKINLQNQNIHNEKQEVLTQFGELAEKLDTQIQHIDKKFEEISTQFSGIQEVQDTLGKTISSLKNTLEEQKTKILDRVQIEQFNTALNEQASSLKQNQETLKSEIKNYTEKTQEQFESLAKTIELIGDGLSQLELQNKSHSLHLEEQRNSLSQFKHKLKELISLSKEDQKTHFENFSRIIESYNENIRTELTIAAQSLKESDTQILDEVSASFMPKKVGKELQKTIADLSNELKLEAQKTRDDLIQGLQENVQEYEKTMEEQNTSIKNYQKQLEQFQDEILAIIDRKVNEKYEIVFSLLSKVAVQAEELAFLIKASEIHIPPPLLQKDQKSSDNSNTIQETQVPLSESTITDDKD